MTATAAPKDKPEIPVDRSAFPAFLADRFAPESCLKWSGTESTWLCRERRADAQVLVKTASEPTAMRCLRNEDALLRAITASDQPAASLFPRTLGLIEAEEAPPLALVRTYIPGRTLESLAEAGYSRPGLPEEEAIGYILQVLEQLDFLHHLQPPVIHRDIKPQNVIVDPEGRCHLIDLGAARADHGPADADTVILGTRLTSPPEQYGFRSTDVRSDLYSVGVLLRYCLTGSYEESADSTLPPGLHRIVRKAVRFDPEKRYRQAAALQRDLRVYRRRHIRQTGGRGIRTPLAALLCAAALALGFGLGRVTAPSLPTQTKTASRDAGSVVITEAMFGGDRELYEAYLREEFLDCTVAILPDGLHFIRYLDFIESWTPGGVTVRTPLTAEELSAYLTALQRSPLWAHGLNLLIVDREVASLEPFRIRYLSHLICVEFRNCSLPDDPSPLEALMPYCNNLACYDCVPVSWTDLGFLRSVNTMDWLVLSFDGVRPVDLSALAAIGNPSVLSLANVTVDADVLKVISGMRNLEVLSLVNCGITDVTALSGLTGLRELYLDSNRITDLSPVEGLPALERLSAEWNPAAGGSAPAGAGQGLCDRP